MIASVLTLSRADCQALRLTDAYGIHRAIYSLFPQVDGQTRDFLFADKGGDFQGRKVLILSSRTPVEPAVGRVESKVIPVKFLEHTHYAFEVRLNPTKRDKTTGKTVPIRGTDNLLAWFCTKAPKHFGFEVLNEDRTLLVQVHGVEVQRFEKDGAVVTLGAATFVGKLRVVDPGLFRKSFEEGLGRAKGFGFGLLQIVPIVLTNQGEK